MSPRGFLSRRSAWPRLPLRWTHAWCGTRHAFDQEPEDASTAPFTRPALFLTGRQDHIVGYRDALARLGHYPRAGFAVLDAAGHNVHLDQPEATAGLLTQWLQQVRRAAAVGRTHRL